VQYFSKSDAAITVKNSLHLKRGKENKASAIGVTKVKLDPSIIEPRMA
jgi:hypothetical protein